MKATPSACNQCRKRQSSCSYRRDGDGDIVSSGIPSYGYDSPPRLRAAINARLGVPPGRKVVTSATPFTDAPLFELRLGLQTGESIDSVLPQRRHADHLVDLFLRHIQPLEPLLERELFDRSYEALYAGRQLEDTDERVFLCTLNTVFALSTQLQEGLPAEERNRAGCTYFRRAWAMLRVEAVLWEPGSLELVQCLLLMGRFLQCSNNPHQTWMAVGTAVRMAQSIGLDKPAPPSSGKPLDRVRHGFAEQLWQCCIYTDRMVSYVAGSTPMVLLQNDKSANREGGVVSSEDGDQIVDYLTNTVELYEISNYILLSRLPIRNGFSAKLGLPPLYRFDEHFGDVSRFDACLDRWANALPQTLRHGRVDGRVDPASYKQALLLQFRAVLPLTHPGCPQRQHERRRLSGFGVRIVQECAALCVENAQKMITLLVDNCGASDGAGVGILPWWYRVLYLHIAGTVLMAATLQSALCSPAVSESWGRAMTALRAHEHLSPFVSQCLCTFETLSSGMGAHHRNHPPHRSHQPYAPVAQETAEGSSGVHDNTGIALPHLQDVSFQDVGFDADDFLFGMEDMSWLGDLGLAS